MIRNKIVKEYKCGWCKYEFEQSVDYVKGMSGSKKNAVSDQVRCLRCLNFIPTWDKVKGVKVRR